VVAWGRGQWEKGGVNGGSRQGKGGGARPPARTLQKVVPKLQGRSGV